MILQIVTLSCPIRVSMKIVKLTVTVKSERVIELEMKTMMLSILFLETKLLKLLKKLKLLVSKKNKNKNKEVTRKILPISKRSYSRIFGMILN